MLEYWKEEPPAHVLLALRYLGPSKRRGRKSEAETRKDLGDVAQMLGQAPQPMPAHLKAMIQQVEQMKKDHKGLNG